MKEEEFGTPYSVEEAREAAKSTPMDEYHQDLIFWLCDKVEELEEMVKERERYLSHGV